MENPALRWGKIGAIGGARGVCRIPEHRASTPSPGQVNRIVCGFPIHFDKAVYGALTKFAVNAPGLTRLSCLGDLKAPGPALTDFQG